MFSTMLQYVSWPLVQSINKPIQPTTTVPVTLGTTIWCPLLIEKVHKSRSYFQEFLFTRTSTPVVRCLQGRSWLYNAAVEEHTCSVHINDTCWWSTVSGAEYYWDTAVQSSWSMCYPSCWVPWLPSLWVLQKTIINVGEKLNCTFNNIQQRFKNSY